jgi:hypothetical protein
VLGDDDTVPTLTKSRADRASSAERMKGHSPYLQLAGPRFSSVFHSMLSVHKSPGALAGSEARVSNFAPCVLTMQFVIGHREKGQDGETPGQLTACGKWGSLGITTFFLQQGPDNFFPSAKSRASLWPLTVDNSTILSAALAILRTALYVAVKLCAELAILST